LLKRSICFCLDYSSKLGLKEALVRQQLRLGLKLASESACTGVLLRENVY
jgi:hypothetical protein